MLTFFDLILFSTLMIAYWTTNPKNKIYHSDAIYAKKFLNHFEWITIAPFNTKKVPYLISLLQEQTLNYTTANTTTTTTQSNKEVTSNVLTNDNENITVDNSNNNDKR